MNIYLKIFVSFDKKFWGDEEFFYYADEKRGSYPAWQNMNAGAYASAFPGQNILMVTVTGEEGKRIERLKDEEGKDYEISLISLFFISNERNPNSIKKTLRQISKLRRSKSNLCPKMEQSKTISWIIQQLGNRGYISTFLKHESTNIFIEAKTIINLESTQEDEYCSF